MKLFGWSIDECTVHWTQSPCPVLSLTCILIGPNRADTKFQEEDDDVDEPGVVLQSLVVHEGVTITQGFSSEKNAHNIFFLSP